MLYGCAVSKWAKSLVRVDGLLALTSISSKFQIPFHILTFLWLVQELVFHLKFRDCMFLVCCAVHGEWKHELLRPFSLSARQFHVMNIGVRS